MAEKENEHLRVIQIMGLLYGQGVSKGDSFKNKILALICLQRPLIAIMGPLMFIAAAALALGYVPSFSDMIIGGIAVYLLTAAEHTIDDTIDKEIDRVKWPDRPLPNEIISRRSGALYAILMASSGVIISYIIFNWQLVVVELFALGLGTLYPFLRDRIGYLILSPIPALIAIGGWVAYSPGTLFTSPVPWILYLVFAFWQAFHIMTLPYAINVAKIFIKRPKPKGVVIGSVVFSLITLLAAIFLSFYLVNPLLFVSVMIVISAVFWISVVPLLKDPTDTMKSLKVVMVATNYNVFMCLALVFIYL